MLMDILLRDEYRKGKAEGRAESILDLLEEFGPVPEYLCERIMQETNQEMLKSMLKAARQAESIEQFMEIYSIQS